MDKISRGQWIRWTAAGLIMGWVLALPLRAAEIVPTGDPGSDCVAASITATKTPANRRYDVLYCSANSSAAAFKTCMRNVAQETVVLFFTDRCNAPEEGAYVSFNGQTRLVWREAGREHPEVIYAGIYRAPGLVVEVVPTRRLRRSLDESTPAGVSVTYEVDVVIRYQDELARVRGMYDDSR